MEERTLELNVEQMFELEDCEDQVQFRYTAKEAGTYIFYFRDLTSNPISISWNQPNIEYYHDPANGRFEGRVVELEKDEDFTVCFGVSEGYDPYGAVVGETTVTIRADFAGATVEKSYFVKVNEGEGALVIDESLDFPEDTRIDFRIGKCAI